MSIKKVVLAYDGSIGSEKALQSALDFAKDTGAEIHIVSVMDSMYTVSLEPVYDSSEIDDLRKNDLMKKTTQAESIYAKHNITSKSIILEGHPAEEIINYSTKVNADIIVCGTRGHGGFNALLLGSIAHKLVTYATIPVLVVK